MHERYPAIDPYEEGLLDVGDGQRIYWEASGNPHGKPALVIHGGPGSGSAPGLRRYFDPSAYRIVLFDQRGCGRSTPHASDPATDLALITTDHLLADIERLREHLAVERWLVFGGSWGCALALIYAERYPERVSEMVLLALATGRRAETDLLTRGLGGIFPEAWARFVAGVPEDVRDGDLAAAYARRLADPDPAVRDRAARDWCAWEDALMPTYPPNAAFADPAHRMAFVRLVTHVWAHGSWLEEGAVLRDAGRLSGIPGVLVQGSLDLGNLIGTPWILHAAWPGSELMLIEDAGHGYSDLPMVDALVAATDRFRARS
ncbi:prolyl aminopeptidase [soil metagenome]